MADLGYSRSNHAGVPTGEARVEDLRRCLQQANAAGGDADDLVTFMDEERELRYRREEREQCREEHRHANVFR